MTTEPVVKSIYHAQTGTWQFIVSDPVTKHAVVIDPVLDFDPAKAAISTTTADDLLSLVRGEGYTVEKILETHVHADHLTAASYLQTRLSEQQGSRPQICIGKRVAQVQDTFCPRYDIAKDEVHSVFDHLFQDDETFKIGNIEAKAIHLPGHTPDHLGYIIGDNVFCGDSLFNADVGSARCDFPGGDAHDLYKSVRKILSLPDQFKLWTGHDYPPTNDSGTRSPLPYQSVAEQREKNKHLRDGVPENDFVEWRKERDSGLGAPRLIHYALQVNVRAGRLPKATGAGDCMLLMPVKVDGVGW